MRPPSAKTNRMSKGTRLRMHESIPQARRTLWGPLPRADLDIVLRPDGRPGWPPRAFPSSLRGF
eukprot:1939666-Pyramimonas_sp.AAC.1